MTTVHGDSEHAAGLSRDGPPCLFLRMKGWYLNMAFNAFHNPSQTYIAMVTKNSEPQVKNNHQLRRIPIIEGPLCAKHVTHIISEPPKNLCEDICKGCESVLLLSSLLFLLDSSLGITLVL